jgi:hypothetical protein
MLREPSTVLQFARPTEAQLAWLSRGRAQPGGKLPLFDEWGQRVHEGMCLHPHG